jgi:hypothetical protein
MNLLLAEETYTMTAQGIDSMHEKSLTISSCLESIPLSSIRNVLSDKAIVGACWEVGVGRRTQAGQTCFF